MKKFCLYTALLFSLLLIPAVYAGDMPGSSEMDKIDAEIADTNYNKALLMLEAYIKQFPQKFDSAQKRIRQIMLARDEYASLSKELITVIQNEPENNEKKLAIIDRLEKLEKYPTAEALAFIQQAKIAAQFTYYRAVFNRVMQEGSDLVAAKKYTAAVDKFKEGFPLYQSDFFTDTADAELTEPVKNSLAIIDRTIPDFSGIQKSLNDVCEAFIKAVKSGSYYQALAAFSAVQSEFSRFARVRNEITRAGQTFDSVLAKMKEADPELTDSSFLPFVSRFTFGRASNPDTGILGAMDAEWNTLVERMKDSVYEQIVDESLAFDKSVEGEQIFDDAKPQTELLSGMQNFAGLAVSVNAIYAMRSNRQGGTDSNFCPQYDASMQFITKVSQSISDQLGVVDSFKRQLVLLSPYEMPQNSPEALRSGKNQAVNRRIEMIPVFEKIKSDSESPLQSDWFALRGGIEKTQTDIPEQNKTPAENAPANEVPVTADRKTPGVPIPDTVLDWQTALNTFSFLCKNTASRADAEAVKGWVDIASYFADAGNSIAGEYESKFAWAESILTASDSERTAPDGSSLAAGLYPKQSLNLVQSLEKTIVQDRKLLTDSQSVLASAGRYQEDFSSSAAVLANSIARLDALSLSGRSIAERANEGILLASRAENEGDLRYNQALQALNKDNFNGAREALQRARAKYNESLSYQTSAELLASSDTKLLSLGESITSRENIIVVAEVRRLKNDARNAYYSGNFEEAETLLTRAKTRWATTNVEEDVEITNLLSMVITALSMQTGRVIQPTAPLYPEMSQILSIANQYYDQGKKLMDQGKRDEAVVILQQAKDKLRELQLVYPLNQEASLLTLRIDRLIDPDTFETMFVRRVKSAQSDYKDVTKRQSAYTDLLDLYAINPDYPGLATLIYNVEIDIGVRQKPVDRAALRRSDTLTANAQKIVSSSHDEIELRRALSFVDEAISLNPQNQNAVVLKDRIQISIGGKATVVLSSADEMRYQRAIQELQNNNIIGAYALVQQLLQSPVNTRSAKVLDLQKKVQALL